MCCVLLGIVKGISFGKERKVNVGCNKIELICFKLKLALNCVIKLI